jgi:hypothetical protein
MNNEKEISFGAFDSELMHQEIFIPEGFEATIDGNKIILKKTESEDEKIRKAILELVRQSSEVLDKQNQNNMIAWLEKQGGQKSTEWDEYDEMYVNALVAIVRKRGATDERLRDELIGWLSCLKCRLGE